jgi:hypothetical protein
MNNSKRLISTAYHETGHVLALLLIRKKFKLVQINVKGGKVKRTRPLNTEIWKSRSFFNPAENHKFFELSFITVAGFIAEYIYRGRGNYRGAMSDFRVWVFLVLNQLPKKMRRSYQHFLVDYTEQVLRESDNWHMVTVIAEALIERKILTYNEVQEIVFNTNPQWLSKDRQKILISA